MTRLRWHSPAGSVALRASETVWLEHLAWGAAEAAWNFDTPNHLERITDLLSLIPKVRDGSFGANFLHRMLAEAQEQEARGAGPDKLRQLVRTLKIVLRLEGRVLLVDGIRLRTESLQLNTALAAGSPPIQLAAKLDGWSGGHVWIEGPDREWAAGIIRRALDVGIYRAELAGFPQGWADVVELLGERDYEAVVCSRTSGQAFPNAGCSDRTYPEGQEDDWYDLPEETRWAEGMAWLREHRPWARLGPDTLDEFYFGPPVTIYDLWAPDRADRIWRAVETGVR